MEFLLQGIAEDSNEGLYPDNDDMANNGNAVPEEQPCTSRSLIQPVTPTTSAMNKRRTLFQRKLAAKRKQEEEEVSNKALKSELYKMEIYKRKLEVFEIENRVGVRHSEETQFLEG